MRPVTGQVHETPGTGGDSAVRAPHRWHLQHRLGALVEHAEGQVFRGRRAELAAVLARLGEPSRLGQPAEIADAVAFVAGDAARWITGQVIRVNGGTV
jgi:3-oxoacyl-[acyl-carrier protein] reductase